MIRIFIGTSTNGEDLVAEKTLAYSLKKHCSQNLEIVFMRNDDTYMGIFDSSAWATPFTNLRWTIPEYCNFSGRAIYMDVDQLNLRDITELYDIDLEGKPFGARAGRFCVMVQDCEKMRSILDPISVIKKHPNYGASIYQKLLSLTHHIDPRWNCLDGEDRPESDIWHLHFTRMASQPWRPVWFKGEQRSHKRPDLVSLWEKYRDEALRGST